MKNGNYIFLSYHEQDLQFVLRLVTSLKNSGVPVWVDCLELTPYESDNSNQQQIVNASAMLAIVSASYLASEQNHLDVAIALQSATPVLYISLGALGVRNTVPPPLHFLSNIEYTVSFTSHTHQEYVQHFDKLLAALRTLLSRVINISPAPKHVQYINSLVSRTLRDVLNDPFNAVKRRAVQRPYKAVAGVNLLGANSWLTSACFAVVAPYDSQYVSKREIFNSFQKITIQDLDNRYPRLVLAGESGSGKTAILQYLLLSAIRRYQVSPSAAPFPVYLNLMDWNGDISLNDFVSMNWPFTDDPFTSFSIGNVALFLDNYEIFLGKEDAGWPLLNQWSPVNAIAGRVVMTCRMSAHLPDHLLQHKLPVAFKINAPTQEPTSSMVSEMIDHLWISSKQSEKTLARKECERALSRLASEMTNVDQTYIPYEIASKYVSKNMLRVANSAHLVDLKGAYVRFSHTLFQAYFAALSLDELKVSEKINSPNPNPDAMRVSQSWDTAVKFFVTFTDNLDRVIKIIAEKDPFWALDCVASRPTLRQDTYNLLVNRAVEFMRLGGDFRLTLAKHLSIFDPPSAKRLLVELVRDSENLNKQQSAIQLFRNIDTDYQSTLNSIQGLADEPMTEEVLALPWKFSQHIMPHLIDLLRASNANMRYAAAKLTGQIHDKGAMASALARSFVDVNAVVATTAVAAALNSKHPILLSHLLQLIQAPPLRHRKRLQRNAIEVLAQFGNTGVENILALLDHQIVPEIRLFAIRSLKSMGLPKVQKSLLHATYDLDVDVRMAAIESLSVYESQNVSRLVEALHDTAIAPHNQMRICDRAAQIVERSQNADLVSIVTEWRANKQRRVKAPRSEEDGPYQPYQATSSEYVKSRLITSKHGGHIRVRGMKQNNNRNPLVSAEDNAQQDFEKQVLIWQLNEGSSESRVVAAKHLSLYKGDTEIISALLHSLQDTNKLVVSASTEALKQVLPGVTAEVLALMEDPAVDLRAAAISIIDHYRDESAITALVRCLGDTRSSWLSDNKICDSAARVLEQINTPQSLAALAEWRNSKIYAVQHENTRDAESAFENLLANLHSNQWHLRQSALVSLQHEAKTLQGSQDASILARQLLTLLSDDDWVVRWVGAESLGWVGDSSSISLLSNLTNDPNWKVRISAIRSLTQIGDPQALDAICKALKDPNHDVREAAAESLGAFKEVATISALVEAVNDSESFVRLAAIESLGKIKDQAVVQPLITALGDESRSVRWAAAQGLSGIADSSSSSDLAKSLEDSDGPYWEQKRISDLILDNLKRFASVDAVTTAEQEASW
jgi:HEAT repeat protein